MTACATREERGLDNLTRMHEQASLIAARIAIRGNRREYRETNANLHPSQGEEKWPTTLRHQPTCDLLRAFLSLHPFV
jgi:hypothetical protein